MATVIAKCTLEEYHRLVETGTLNGKHVELIKGEIIEMPPEGEPHAQLSNDSGNYLVRLLGERATVRRAKPITLPDQSEPEPDIAVVQPLGKEYRSHHPYLENVFWVIEYSDSSVSKDLDLKTKVYAEVEISEYWIVNLKTQTLIVFREPQSGQYTSSQEYSSETITPLAFNDIAIEIDTLIK